MGEGCWWRRWCTALLCRLRTALVVHEAERTHSGNDGGQQADSGRLSDERTQGMLGGCGMAVGKLRLERVGCQGLKAA